MSQTALTDVAVVIKTNSKPTGDKHNCLISRDPYHIVDPHPSEYYYMLTEDLPEDKKLRQEIHLKKLVRNYRNHVYNYTKRTWTQEPIQDWGMVS